MRHLNRHLVLRMVREHGPVTRADLSRLTGLTAPAVGDIAEELLEDGLIERAALGGPRRGRQPVPIQIRPGGRLVVGLAIGSEWMRAGLVDLAGRALTVVSRRLPLNPDDALALAARLVHDLLAMPLGGRGRPPAGRSRLLGVGVAMHGVVDPAEGISILPPQLAWRSVPIRRPLEALVGLPVKVDNDCNAVALAERWYGAGRGVESFVSLRAGYGIGAGVVVGDRLFRGAHHGAGQIGHVTVSEDGPRCSCGNYGCLEAMASEPAVLRSAIRALKRGQVSRLLDLAVGDPDGVTAAHLYQAASEGDALAFDVLEGAGRHLGLGVATLVNLFDPGRIIVEGPLGGETVLAALRDVVKRRSLATNLTGVDVVPSPLGDAADIIGAATLWIADLFNGDLPSTDPPTSDTGGAST